MRCFDWAVSVAMHIHSPDDSIGSLSNWFDGHVF